MCDEVTKEQIDTKISEIKNTLEKLKSDARITNSEMRLDLNNDKVNSFQVSNTDKISSPE